MGICRDPYCVMAIEAVELLRREGYSAHRMEQGIADSRERGWRVVAASELARSARTGVRT